MDPLSFEFKLADFDLSLLPQDTERLKGDGSMPQSTVQEHLRGIFRRLPGRVRILPHDDHISVRWIPEAPRDIDSMVDLVTGLIRRRALAQAEPILRTLFSSHPEDRRVLFNLGTLLCEQGRLKEARQVLKRLTRTAPEFAGGWHALGVALSGEGKRKDALDAFQKSLTLDPDNGHTLRNLGALMGGKDPQKALPYLKRAAKLLPSDQAAQYVYGKGLMESGNPADADPVLKRAIALDEYSEIADLCREARITIGRTILKGAVPRGVRTDVVVHCLAALEKFKELGRERTQAIVFEIASLCSSGLNMNDPNSRYRLRSLPGEFSALQLVVHMVAGLKKVAPRTDPGIDFSKEVAFALRMSRGEKGKPKPRKPR